VKLHVMLRLQPSSTSYSNVPATPPAPEKYQPSPCSPTRSAPAQSRDNSTAPAPATTTPSADPPAASATSRAPAPCVPAFRTPARDCVPPVSSLLPLDQTAGSGCAS